MSEAIRPAELMRKSVISEELSGKFFVPSYQRGYRWGESEVVKLLDDIKTSVVDVVSPRSYYLQPIVVMRRESEGDWELIDGQQRLTTLFLILKCIRDNGWLPGANVNYEISYETRPNSRTYLQSEPLDPELRHENIDFHHIYSAYQAIDAWFRSQPDQQQAAIDIRTALAKHVYVLWYEAPQGTDRNELFRRLNVGRIPLTDAELIKAQILSGLGDSGNKAERQEQVAVQWDAFERELRDSELWAFITGSNEEWPTHMDLIFRAMAGSAEGNESIRYWVFEELRPRIEKSASDFWRDVVRMHGTIVGWFHDHELYHHVGYLVATGDKYEFERIVELADGRTNREFRRGLVERVRDRIGPRTRTDLDDLNYEQRLRDCSRVLLLMNVATVLKRDNENDRFSFRAHANGDWSVEHIHAQSAAALNREVQWRTWLSSHKRGLEALSHDASISNSELIEKIDDVLAASELKREVFRHLEDEILAAFADASDSALGDDVHLLPNLALLDRGHNSALGNSVFEVKRQAILRLDREGDYIPPCTRNVFLKYYTSDADQQIHLWGPQDRHAYYDAMREVLEPYLVPEEQEGVTS